MRKIFLSLVLLGALALLTTNASASYDCDYSGSGDWYVTSYKICDSEEDNTTVNGNLYIDPTGHLVIINTNLTVDGDVELDGILDVKDSNGTISFGSLYINASGVYNATPYTTYITDADDTTPYPYALDNDGKIIANSGTFEFTRDSSGAWTNIDAKGIVSSDNLYDVILSGDSTWVLYASSTVIDNDLTIDAGTFRLAGTNWYFSVTGDVVVNDGATFGITAPLFDGMWSLGSLTVNNGGTFNAPGNTTSIYGDLIVRQGGTVTGSDNTVFNCI